MGICRQYLSSTTVATVIAIAILLTGCNSYELSLNEKLIYSPPPLFSDYSILDEGLKECVRGVIQESDIRTPDAMTHIVCPAGNIVNLEGIEIFTQLTHLGLADNKVGSVATISTMHQLQQLDLRGNNLVDVSELAELTVLNLVNLTENFHLECSSLSSLTQIDTVIKPSHCM